MTAKQKIAALVACLGTMLALAAAPAVGAEQIQIANFNTTSTSNQAGGHPDLETEFELLEAGKSEAAKNVTFNAPQGLFGNINVVTNCQPAEFALEQCPPNSQVGVITVYDNAEGNEQNLLGTAPLYDVEPQENQTALLQFIVPTLGIPISIPITVRTSTDYGLRLTVSDITQLTPLTKVHLHLWGFPASPAHSAERFPAGSLGKPAGCPGLADTTCNPKPTISSLPNDPFTDNPTRCTGEPLVTELAVETYQHHGELISTKGQYPAMEGCEKETFKPLLQGRPTTDETDSAAGLDINLSAKQFEGPAASPSEIKSAIVTLPEGLTINPDAADGQSACTDAQANFSTEGPAECPDNAKIGTISVGSPTLDGRLVGSLYFGEPKPGDQYRLFMVFDGFGIHAKLVGSAKPDPTTGQVTVYFENLPQVPFEDFDIHLFASDRGLMATPTKCDIYPLKGHFFPWDEALPDQNSLQFFSLEHGPHGTECPGPERPFHPHLEAGTSNPVAGAFSDFHLKLDREDGDQYLGDLTFRMPPGFTGDLRGISYCPDGSIAAAESRLGRAELSEPSCPSSSLIGTTNVAAGPGGHPFHAIGKMYMAGPFKGAPLSVVAITPALAGPYDYGVVVVRVALHVNPETAQVFAASDTVPSIIGGVPIRMRSIQVNLERKDANGNPNFTINPTNCDPFAVESQGIGDEGATVGFSSYFNVVNCSSLPFAPQMKIRQLGKRRSTRRGANPELQFDLRTRAGDANVKSISVTLPNAFEIDQEHLGNICTEKLLVETQCAGKQQIGEAFTETPLLDQPLGGAVYAVSGSGGLPRLAFILNGQVDLLPRADTKTVSGGRLQTTVPVVPDAPIGHFHLVIFGGKRGYLANTRSLCGKPAAIKVAYTAQNQITTAQSIKVKAPCGKHKARHKRHRRHAGPLSGRHHAGR